MRRYDKPPSIRPLEATEYLRRSPVCPFEIPIGIDSVCRVSSLPDARGWGRGLRRLDDEKLSIAGRQLEEIRKSPEAGFTLRVAGFGFVFLYATVVFGNEPTVGLDFLRDADALADPEFLEYYDQEEVLVPWPEILSECVE